MDPVANADAAVKRPLKASDPELTEALCIHLVRTTAGSKKPLPMPSEDQLDKVARRLQSAMLRLLGPTVVGGHQACETPERHSRGRICTTCGYSDNLYAQELRRILKRIR